VIWPAHHELVYWYKIKGFGFVEKCPFQMDSYSVVSNLSFIQLSENHQISVFSQHYHLYIMACNLIAVEISKSQGLWTFTQYSNPNRYSIISYSGRYWNNSGIELSFYAMARITEFVIETSIGGTREVLNQFVISCVIACKMVHSEGPWVGWILLDGIKCRISS